MLHLCLSIVLCIKKGDCVGSLTSVKIKIFSKMYVISVDVLAPAIEKLMQAKKL